MASENKVFNSWEEWATTDWKEFCIYFKNKYGIPELSLAEREFANQLKVSTHVFQQITNIAIGKGIEYGVSATLGSILSIGDFMSRIAGFGYVAGIQKTLYTRDNPHTLVATSVFNDDYTFNEGHLPDYVQFILYCYPKDLEDGYYGFRYGLATNGSSLPLRRKKSI